ncbi:MAG: ATP-grasp domain-containing protein [Clostridia bacterium]|nr:ATP-grasp domain-containing protein [Clostridia bacterium]
MSFENTRVLVLDGGGRQALPVLKWLHDLKCHITTVNSSKLDIGYASRFPKGKLLTQHPIYDTEEKENFIDKEIRSGKYDVVIPLSDLSTQYISKHLDEYSKYIRTFVPEYSVFMKAYDKQQTMEICQEHDIPCTRTKESDEAFEDFIEKVGYPIVVKPRSGCGSVGFRCLHSDDEWKKFVEENDNPDEYVVQEYVNQDGRQYNVHLFMDGEENVVFAVPTQKCRWFPVDGGASCFCRTVDRPDLVEQCIRLLKAVHWKGYCEIEMIEDVSTGTEKIIEINGRTSASIKICQLYGVNIGKGMLALAYGERLEPQPFVYRDARMRCIHTDLLWFLKSNERFKSSPSWFNNRHTRDQIFSLSDPLPFFTFSVQSLAKYKKEMKKRSR